VALRSEERCYDGVERWDVGVQTRGPGCGHELVQPLLPFGAVGDTCFVSSAASGRMRQAFSGFASSLAGRRLKWVSASYDSICGTIRSAWKVNGRSFSLDVTIPANTVATGGDSRGRPRVCDRVRQAG